VLALASTVIPDFFLLEIHDPDFHSILEMHVYRQGVSSSTKEGSVSLCTRYLRLEVNSRFKVNYWRHLEDRRVRQVNNQHDAGSYKCSDSFSLRLLYYTEHGGYSSSEAMINIYHITSHKTAVST
jgi:hypothetical protein